MLKDFSVSDKVTMKKPHPCGSNLWVVVRVGADVKIECLKCKRIVMLKRSDFEKYAKLYVGP